MVKKVLFIGAKQLGKDALKTLFKLSPESLAAVVTIDDKTDGERTELEEIRNFCKLKKKKLYILKKSSELENIINIEKPDMCIVVGWYWILKQELLDKVPQGFLGIHASMLPKYRGGAPLVWSIIEGEKETGVSFFYFSAGMDSGDIVGQVSFKIKLSDTISDVLKKASNATTKLLKKNYPLLLKDQAHRTRQDNRKATFVGQRKPEDGKINFQNSNIDIYNLVRAQSKPYSGAFCYHGKDKVYIWKASLSKKEREGRTGQIVAIENGKPVVKCAKGSLRLNKIQIRSEAKAEKPLALFDILK